MAWKIEDLPKVGSSKRILMLQLMETEMYEEDIKGSAFFSSDELRSIEKTYKDRGITKAEIMNKVEKRLMLKWNTVKNYIQNDLVPRALRREKTEKGMISVYPANFIRHLNLVRYCLLSHKQSLQPIADLFAAPDIDDHTLIVAESQDSGSGISGDDCFHEFWTGDMRSESGIQWISESIRAARIDEERKRSYLEKIATIERLTNQAAELMRAFEMELKSYKSPHPHITLATVSARGEKETSS